MIGVDPYVPTKAVRDAAEGRETAILAGLGIRWRNGKPHIPCPYPEHADKNPSWRWDDRKARAYCTCARSHSIFDLVSGIRAYGTDLLS
jgi:hypothetical protein